MKGLTLAVSIVGLTFAISNCSSPPPKVVEEIRAVPAAPGLYIKTTSTQRVSKDSTAREESLTTMTDDYFDVSLKSYSDGKYYQAARDVEKYDPVTRHMVWLDVTDSLGAPLQFQTSTNFLNHMSARAYEMVAQSENKYGFNYTFKRKI